MRKREEEEKEGKEEKGRVRVNEKKVLAKKVECSVRSEK